MRGEGFLRLALAGCERDREKELDPDPPPFFIGEVTGEGLLVEDIRPVVAGTARDAGADKIRDILGDVEGAGDSLLGEGEEIGDDDTTAAAAAARDIFFGDFTGDLTAAAAAAAVVTGTVVEIVAIFLVTGAVVADFADFADDEEVDDAKFTVLPALADTGRCVVVVFLVVAVIGRGTTLSPQLSPPVPQPPPSASAASPSLSPAGTCDTTPPGAGAGVGVGAGRGLRGGALLTRIVFAIVIPVVAPPLAFVPVPVPPLPPPPPLTLVVLYRSLIPGTMSAGETSLEPSILNKPRTGVFRVDLRLCARGGICHRR